MWNFYVLRGARRNPPDQRGRCQKAEDFERFCGVRPILCENWRGRCQKRRSFDGSAARRSTLCECLSHANFASCELVLGSRLGVCATALAIAPLQARFPKSQLRSRNFGCRLISLNSGVRLRNLIRPLDMAAPKAC